jgi:ferredoxin, 2Fe-2S
MPFITYVLPDGERRRIEMPARGSVMTAAIDNNVPGIMAECGGACACGTCHVYIDPAYLDRLPPAQPMEDDILLAVAAERKPESRLSCQINLTEALDGLVVIVPDRQI